MRCRVYRNLDRPFTFLGVKGRYIPVALIGLLGIVVTAVIVGAALGTFAGLASAVVLIVGGYLAHQRQLPRDERRGRRYPLEEG